MIVEGGKPQLRGADKQITKKLSLSLIFFWRHHRLTVDIEGAFLPASSQPPVRHIPELFQQMLSPYRFQVATLIGWMMSENVGGEGSFVLSALNVPSCFVHLSDQNCCPIPSVCLCFAQCTTVDKEKPAYLLHMWSFSCFDFETGGSNSQ